MSLLRATIGAAAAVVALHARAAVALAATSEDTPLKLSDPDAAPVREVGGGSGDGIVRTIVGLAVVVAVIWGLSWVLRQVKSSREERASGSGLSSLGTLPLGANRSVHVVRAGREVLLLGVSEHQITRLGSWSQSEAEAHGLIAGPDDAVALPDPVPALPGSAPARSDTAPQAFGRSAGDTARQLLEELRRRTVRR